MVKICVKILTHDFFFFAKPAPKLWKSCAKIVTQMLTHPREERVGSTPPRPWRTFWANGVFTISNETLIAFMGRNRDPAFVATPPFPRPQLFQLFSLFCCTKSVQPNKEKSSKNQPAPVVSTFLFVLLHKKCTAKRREKFKELAGPVGSNFLEKSSKNWSAPVVYCPRRLPPPPLITMLKKTLGSGAISTL